MKKNKLDRIINFIREEGGAAPTMNTGSTAGKPGFSNKADATGPTAGFTPVLGMGKKRKRYLKLGHGSRKRWMKKDES